MEPLLIWSGWAGWMIVQLLLFVRDLDRYNGDSTFTLLATSDKSPVCMKSVLAMTRYLPAL